MSSNQKRPSSSARLPQRESYPLSEVAAAWKQDVSEDQLVDYIRLGKLTCCVLLTKQEDRPVKVRAHDVGAPPFRVLKRIGHYRLLPSDAVDAYYRTDSDLGTSQQIVATEPRELGFVQGWSARKRDLRVTHEERERFARECGLGEAEADEARPETEPPPGTDNVFRKRGSRLWQLVYEGKEVLIPHTKGMDILAHLLRNPNQDVDSGDLLSAAAVEPSELTGPQAAYVAQLAGESSGPHGKGGAVVGDDFDDVADARARDAYKQKLGELKEDLADAQRNNDMGREAQVQQQINVLKEHIKSVYRPGGRSRKTPDLSERNRKRALKLIHTAMRRIEKDHEALGSHLFTAIKTGAHCSYRPDTHLNWKF